MRIDPVFTQLIGCVPAELLVACTNDNRDALSAKSAGNLEPYALVSAGDEGDGVVVCHGDHFLIRSVLMWFVVVAEGVAIVRDDGDVHCPQAFGEVVQGFPIES